MKHIGIISDTHGYWDPRYETYLGEMDEVWHAGDIGSLELADRFEAMHPIFRAVYGNCDGYDLRGRYPEKLRFKCEDVDVLLKHIGGYPGTMTPRCDRCSMPRRPNSSSAGTRTY